MGADRSSIAVFLISLIFLISFVNAVSFLNPANTWIIPSAYPNYNYQVASAPYEAYFKNNSDLTKAARVIMNGYTFDFDIATSQAQWYNSSNGAIMGNSLNPLNTNATIAGSTITYPNAWSGTNLSYTLFDNEVKETLAITSIPNPVGVADYFRYKINLYYNNSLQVCFDNGTCYLHPSNVKVVTNGGITFKDAKNTTIFYIPPPNVTDSAGNSANATYFLNLNNGVDLWYLAIPKSFIDNAPFPIYLDPTVALTAGAPFPIVLTPLNGTRFVATYCHDEAQYYKFQVYDVSGTQIVAETASGWKCYGYYQSLDVAPINSSDWLTCLPEYAGDTLVCEQWHYSGTTATSASNITVTSANTYASRQVSVTMFSPTLFGVAWNWKSANWTLAVQYLNGTQKCITLIDNFDSGAGIGISAYNSTYMGVVYQNSTGKTTYKTYDTSCNQVAFSTLTNNINYGKRTKFKTVNNTYGVLAQYDYSVAEGDAFEVVDSSGANHTAYTKYVNVPLNRHVVGLSVSNNTNFSVGSMNDTGGWSNYSFKTYNIAGTAQTGIINVETKSTLTPATSTNEFAMSSWEQAVGIGFCQKEGMAIAYDNTTTQSILAFYYYNGTTWDGTCGGAPQTLSVNYSDTITYSQLLTTLITRVETISDSATYADLMGRGLILLRYPADSATYGEVMIKAISKGFSDSVTYGELTGKGLGKFLSDSVTYSELKTRGIILSRSISDYAIYTESIVRQSILVRTLSDSLAYAESMIKQSVFNRFASDSVTYAESVVADTLKIYSEILADSVAYAELMVKQSIFARALYDSAAYSELAGRQIALIRIVSDSVTYVESVVASALHIYSEVLLDSMAYGESLLPNINLTIIVSDSLTYMESMITGTMKIYSKMLSDSLTYAEVMTRQIILTRPVSDSFMYAESLARQLNLQRAVSDSVAYAESAVTSALHIYAQVLSDSVSYAESIARQFSLGVVVSDFVTYDELLSRTGAYLTAVSDYATYAESMIRQISITRVMSDSMAYSERLVKSIGISLYDYVEYGENALGVQVGKTFVYLYDSVTYAEDVLNSAFTAFTSTVVQMPYVPSVSDVFVFTSDNGLIWGVTVGLLGMAYLYSRRKKDTQDEETLNEEFGNDNEE